MLFDPTTLPIADRYKLLIGGIIPRPIALVGTVNAAGAFNLAPYSFFAGLGSNPMSLLFCPANKSDGTEKDSLRNCRSVSEGGTGVFSVNIMNQENIRRTVAAAEELAFGESEFELSGLHPVTCSTIAAPRVQEAGVCYECKTIHILQTNPGAPSGGNVVIGEVLAVHVRDDAINERLHIDPSIIQPAGRLGGMSYCSVRDRFELPMGRAALDLGQK
jgi:flavin reductase (DIM6/NTAB) family NADH-FMN oxidoreductase RutF